MSPDPEAERARLRAIALALPGTEEKVSHGQTVFGIAGGRLFAQLWHDHHGDGETAVMVKTDGVDAAAMLIEADPARLYRPAYIGPAGWLAIRVGDGDADWDDVAARVAASWRRVAPRRLLKEAEA